jgi:signal transduction histidine kinase
VPSCETTSHAYRRTDYYGAFAFGSVIVTCFLQFAVSNRLSAPVWQLAATFVLGGIYAVLGVLYSPLVRRWGARSSVPLYLLLVTVVTAMLYLSPAKGFFGIIVLPMVSLAIFEFSMGWAIFAGVSLFAISVGVFWQAFGARAIPEAIMSYTAAFAFTAGFSIIPKQAIAAKERSDQLSKELAEANQKLRDYAAQVDELATTRERNRLAREIHDGLGHYLTVAKTQLDAAAALLPANPERARDSVVKAAHLTAEALDDVRRSVGSLRTDTARPPLPEALRLLTQEAGLPVTVRLEGTTRPLPPGIEHALFRSAQEGLTNIRKHAAASAAEIALDFLSPGRVTLSVTDNGRGVNGDLSTAGFGLIGIRERIEVLGGRVASGNRAAGGFVLTIEVPA